MALITAYGPMLKKEFQGYNLTSLKNDFMAGMTVTAVAIPLALAFSFSSGADAAAGLITAIIAGLVIGGLSGASYQISGPTGAMSAILVPLIARHGLNGMFWASLMSGVLLLLCAFLKAGKLVRFIPPPVITGFTSGIAVVIALGQTDNFFGVSGKGGTLIKKLLSYWESGFHINGWNVLIGLAVVGVMAVYPKKWSVKFPASLLAIIIATAANILFKFPVSAVGEIPRTLLP